MNFIKKIIFYFGSKVLGTKRWILRKYYTFLVKIKVKSYVKPLTVNSHCQMTRNTILGRNTNFNGMKISGCGTVTIGDNFHSGVECRILSENHNYEGEAIPYDNTAICKDVVIEDNVWFGDRVLILPGVIIGEGAIIQAGSVVTKSIPKYAIAGGNPAAVFKQRDKDHYEKLKGEKKFL